MGWTWRALGAVGDELRELTEGHRVRVGELLSAAARERGERLERVQWYLLGRTQRERAAEAE